MFDLGNICQTCLSTDRKLICLNNLKMSFSDMNLEFQDPGGGICWECKSLVMKYQKFREQVRVAQKILKEEIEFTDLKSLSALTINIINGDEELVIHCDEIKPEPLYDTFIEIEKVKRETEDNSSFENDEVSYDAITDIKLDLESDNSLDSYDSDEIENKNKPIISHADPEKKNVIAPFGDGSVNVKLKSRKVEIKPEKCSIKNDNGNTLSKFVIVTLTDDEMLDFREKQKSNEIYKASKYKCEHCLISFESIKVLNDHSNSHENIGEFACDVCSLHFSTAHQVSEHKKAHYMCYKCKICDQVEQEMGSIWKHCQKEHSEVPRKYKCKQCLSNFKTEAAYMKHVKKGHMYKCDECGETFNKRMLLYVHNKIKNHNIPPSKCDLCDKEFKGRQGLSVHMRTHNKQVDESAYCVECGIQYNNVYGYRQHLRTSLKHVSRKDLRHGCPHCEMRFVAPGLLESHITSRHTDRYDYKCQHCDKIFKTSVTLRKHILKKHIRGGVAPRNKVCDICGKAFTAKVSLQEHMNKHTGARPFACTICEATFSYSAALYNHTQLVHKGVQRKKIK